MTEEQKHEEAAGQFADALGNLEGAIKKPDSWQVREAERHDLYRRDVESAEKDRLSSVADRDHYKPLNARSFEIQEDRAKRDAETHAQYLAELKHVQAHREREVHAFERIADALEKLTAGK